MTQRASPRWLASKVYLDSIPEHQRDQVIEDLCLTFPTWFFEVLVEYEGGYLALEDFQVQYLLDTSTLKVANKTRQAGASMVVSMAKFYRAFTIPGYKCQIVSINLRESVDKIKYIRIMHDTLPDRFKIPLTIDNALSIGFHTGSKLSVIESIAASGAVRGGRKELVFDEFAHYFPRGKDEELFKAAAPAIINGDLQLDIISTPNGKGNYFDRIYNNLPDEDGERPFSIFSRHEFIWLDVRRFVKPGEGVSGKSNYDEVRDLWYNVYKRDMSKMRDLVKAYGSDRLLFFYKIFPWSMFQQEFCGAFITDEGAFINWDTVRSCIKGSIAQADDWMGTQTDEATWEWDRTPDTCRNDVYMGLDFGQSGEDDDKTSIQVFEKDANGVFRHRYSEFLSKKDYPTFPAQADHIARLIRAFRPSRIGADNTGLGLGVIPLILERAPNVNIDRVSFTNQSKEDMAHRVKALMQNNQVWLLENAPQLHAEIAGMRRETTALGSPQFFGSPHDDGFWSMALALKVGDVQPVLMYTLGKNRSNFPF